MSGMRKRRLARKRRIEMASESPIPVRKPRPPVIINPPVWNGDPERLFKGDVENCIAEINRIFDLRIGSECPAMDTIPGRSTTGRKNPNGFPSGSIFREEGQFLYSIVQELNPRLIVEIGTWYGCSASHMAQALDDMLDIGGRIVAIDNCIEGISLGFDKGDCKTIGSMIPDNLRKYVEIRIANMEEELCKFEDESVDLIFEDSLHTYFTTYYIANESKRILKPGGFLITHDILYNNRGLYSSNTVEHDMRKAFQDAGMFDEFYAFLIGTADTGVGIWRKPQ